MPSAGAGLRPHARSPCSPAPRKPLQSLPVQKLKPVQALTHPGLRQTSTLCPEADDRRRPPMCSRTPRPSLARPPPTRAPAPTLQARGRGRRRGLRTLPPFTVQLGPGEREAAPASPPRPRGPPPPRGPARRRSPFTSAGAFSARLRMSWAMAPGRTLGRSERPAECHPSEGPAEGPRSASKVRPPLSAPARDSQVSYCLPGT